MTTEAAPSETKKVRGRCPKCGPDRWAIVKGEFSKHESDGAVWSDTTYRILQCPACEEVYCQSDFVFSEDTNWSEHPVTGEVEYDYDHKIEHWPHTPPDKRKRPDWFDKLLLADEDIHSLLGSVYSALEHDLSVLAAIGIRTVFDRASELLGIAPSRTFGEKLSGLVDLGKIGVEQRETLAILTDAGSAAAHRGWRPSSEELDTMMTVIEMFLHNAFVIGDAVTKLKARVPEKIAQLERCR